MKRTRFHNALVGFLTLLFVLGCGSGGSTGPGEPEGPGDLTLRYCRVVNVDGQMHAQWAADLPTRGEIRYGRDVYTQQINVTSDADSHDVALTGLSFDTHYIYRITVRDSLSRAVQREGDFTTPAKASPEPVISNVQITDITESAATVTWDTDEPATTILYYGIGTADDSVTLANMVTEHSVHLTGLLSSSVYRMRPEAVNASNLRGIGPDTSLATPARLMIQFADTAIPVGDTIQLPIRIVDAENLAGLRFGITFETGMVEVVSVDEGPFFTDRRGFIFFSDIRNSEGVFIVDMTWNVDYDGNRQVNTDADGSGIVAYARLRGLEMGEVDMAFNPDSTYGLDMFANMRACSLSAGSIEVRP